MTGNLLVVRRSDIIAEARSWIGTPYAHQASVKGIGCDCLGLVRGVWRVNGRRRAPAGPKPLRSPQTMPSMSFARRAMRAALLLMPLLILASCATTTASVGTDAVACSAFEPIRWSKNDTDETIRQVKEHNAAWAAICARD
jgi:hypothetical protein